MPHPAPALTRASPPRPGARVAGPPPPTLLRMAHVKVVGHGPYEVDLPVAEIAEKISSVGGGRFNLTLAGGHVVVINPTAAAVIEIRESGRPSP